MQRKDGSANKDTKVVSHVLAYRQEMLYNIHNGAVRTAQDRSNAITQKGGREYVRFKEGL